MLNTGYCVISNIGYRVDTNIGYAAESGLRWAINETNFIGGASPRRYIEVVNAHPTIMHLLKAILLSALAGGLAYGLTVWLASDSGSALLVAFIVAAITAVGVFAPSIILRAFDSPRKSPWTAHDASSIEQRDSTIVNPATGLPMMGGLAGLDAGGNTLGSGDETALGDDENLS